MTSDQLLVGVGRVLRLVAAAPGALEEYERSQTLSAYSVTRLLAAEQAAAGELLAQTRDSLLAAMRDDERPAVRGVSERIELARDELAIGDALANLLRQLDRDDPLRRRVHGVLAEMIDSEVAALAAAPK